MTPQLTYGRSLTLDTARRVVAAAERVAVERDLPSVIAVVDAGGHLVALERLDHTQHGSIRVAEAKAKSAVAFKRSTKVFEDSLAQTVRILALGDAVPVAGGLPLVIEGEIVGGIGAAGATPEQDAEIAAAGAAALGPSGAA